MKKAFTLAETLITLGIISIVAALTIPAVLTRHRNKILETSFLKAVSEIQNVLALSMNEYGITTLENMLEEEFETKFLPILLSHFKINVYKIDAVKYPKYAKQNFSNTTMFNTCLNTTKTTDKIYQLTSGMTFCFRKGGMIGDYGVVGYEINFDINGDKKPNRGGFDVWAMEIKKNAKPYYAKEGMNYCAMAPHNYDGDMYDTQGGYTHKSNGRYCAYYALNNICPDSSGRKYFECLPK